MPAKVLPMNKDTAAHIKSILDKSIRGRKEFQQVLALIIVYINLQMFERPNQLFLQWPPQDRDDMADAARLDGFAAAQCP